MSASGPIRVVIADDHPLYREAVASAIRADTRMDLVAAFDDGRRALEGILEHRPDVAVLDVRMPNLDGPEVLRRLRSEEIATQFLLVSAHGEGSVVHAALSAGARGYLTKDTSAQAIRDGIVAVFEGRSVLGSDASSALLGRLHESGQADAVDLTDREREVLTGLAKGQSVAEIAGGLHLIPATVKTHLQTLYGKLGVSERAAAVAEAMRAGVLR